MSCLKPSPRDDRQYLGGSNVNEQITWITEGTEVYSQGRRYIMKAGHIMLIPPNVPHEFIFTEDTIDIDIFAPGRQDWLDGTAAHYTE
jgi:quercetin dioxygenase-like cupin family protein